MNTSLMESSAPGLLETLFPYIYGAADRMSTRAISRYLAENHNMTFSHSTISRALRASEMHIESISAAMSVHAGILARAGGITEEQILFDEHTFQMIAGHNTSLSPKAQQAFDYLESTWYTYPEDFRNACYKFFIAHTGEEDE